jgi:hypothetical protein
MYGTTQELARQRQSTLLRDAETFRLTKETRAVKAAERRAGYRKVVTAALAMVAWPIKH